MRSWKFVALLGLVASGPAYSDVICTDPPGPAMAPEAKVSCANPFEVIEYFDNPGSGSECPVENLMSPSPGTPHPGKGDLVAPGARAKDFQNTWICRDEPISAYLVCDTDGTQAHCDAFPAEVNPAGNLWHTVEVWAANGAYSMHYGNRVDFACPAGNEVQVRLTVVNGAATSTATGTLQCGSGGMAAPGYVSSVGVGCANIGVGGYNRVTIGPPLDGGTPEYYVIDTSSVRYAHGWQRQYSSANNVGLVKVTTESYVRAAACNAGGCGPLVQSGQRAYAWCN